MRKVKQLLGSALVASAILFVVTGCGQGGGNASGDQGGGVDRIQIGVTNYPIVLSSLPYQVGVEKGLFEKEGVEIERVIPGSGGGTSVRNVLSGELPFGEVSGAAAIQSHLAGAPVTIISGAVPNIADFHWVTRKDAPFEKAEDLVGKKWAYTNPGSAIQMGTLLSLQEQGIDPKSVEMVAAGGLSEGITLLQEGEVDVAVLVEPIYSDQKDKFKTLYHGPDYVDKFQETLIISSPKVIEEDPELVRKFMSGYQRSVEWIKQNPEEAAKIYAKNTEVSEEAAFTAVELGIEEDFWDSTPYAESLNNVVEGLRLAGILQEGDEILWDELLNQEFLPEDKRIDASELDSNK